MEDEYVWKMGGAWFVTDQWLGVIVTGQWLRVHGGCDCDWSVAKSTWWV